MRSEIKRDGLKLFIGHVMAISSYRESEKPLPVNHIPSEEDTRFFEFEQLQTRLLINHVQLRSPRLRLRFKKIKSKRKPLPFQPARQDPGQPDHQTTKALFAPLQVYPRFGFLLI